MAQEWREVLAKRRRTSKTKRLYEDGQATNRYSWDGMVGMSLHYEALEGSGEWLEVDPRIVPSSEPGWDWEMQKSHWRFLVRNGGWFAAEKQGVGIGFRLERVAYLNIETKEWQTIRTANYTTPTVTEIEHGNDLLANPLGKLTWANLFPGVDFEIHVSGDRLHEEIKISQAARDAMPALPYPAADTYLVMVYEVDWGQVPGLADDDGDINHNKNFERQGRLYLKNHQGQIVTVLPVSKAWPEGRPVDEEGEPVQVLLRKRFVKIGGQYYLLVGAPALALNALPQGTIIFDPDIWQIAADTDDARAYDGSLSHSKLYPFHGTYKNGMRWSIDIPDASTIISATVELCSSHTSSTSTVSRGQIYDEDSCAAFTAAFWERAVMAEFVDVYTNPDWVLDSWYHSADISTLVQAFIDRPGYVEDYYLGLRIWYQSGDHSFYPNVYQREDDSAKAAKLHIEYSVGGQDYPVSVSLSRVAAVTAGGQAAALGSAALGRSAGVTEGGQAASLAAASLARSAGMSATRVRGAVGAISLARAAGLSDAGQGASLGTMTLDREGGISTSALAAALAAASLARQAGLTDSGQAAALASTILSRSEGIMQAASAQALSSILTEIFKALTVSWGIDVAVSFTLDRLAALSVSGKADSAASVSLARHQAISLLAQALALAGVDFSLTRTLVSSGVITVYAVFEVPSERIYIVLAEDRVYVVPAESRIYTVPEEDRTYRVPEG